MPRWRREVAQTPSCGQTRPAIKQRDNPNWRALVEADVARWKRVIGDRLRFQTDGRQATEVAIATNVLNRMLDLGRPEYIRIA